MVSGALAQVLPCLGGAAKLPGHELQVPGQACAGADVAEARLWLHRHLLQVQEGRAHRLVRPPQVLQGRPLLQRRLRR